MPGGLLPEPDARKIRLLKAICIALGVMIVAALATIVLAIIFRDPKPKAIANANGSVVQVIPSPGESVPLALAELAVPQGSTITRVVLEGNRLVLVAQPPLIDGAGGHGEVIILDIATGEILSRIRLRGAPGAASGQ